MTKKVKVIAVDTEEVLLEVPIEKLAEAYEYAAKMDQMGIEVKLDAPTVADTLSDTLGLSIDDRHRFESSMDEELRDHDGSCCAKPHDFKDDKVQ